jgi:TRAP-type C4-dicarboxylate transport system permease large subunit
MSAIHAWRLARPPAELLASVVVVAAAVPTAYSGASGIFVIAAGAVIYDELRRAGARNELAIAATAMSGSLGVVLSPCLLVVIVASLNKQVTTSELFSWGYVVFGLTAALTVIVLLARRKGPLRVAPLSEAVPGSLRALAGVAPYVLVLLVTLAVFGFGLHAWMDEHSAANIVLVVLLLFVLYEGRARSLDGSHPFARIAGSTTETTVHIGALLALMAFSVAFGGIIERAEVMSLVPSELGGPWPTMVLLVLLLVVVGMLMDPYGAVILVSATIANVAYENGIAPIHFWMTVLCAFELGYLTPPVALNHLLTRLVIGAENADEEDWPADASFVDRNERYVLPVVVMGTALLLVAFVPLAVSGH